VEVLGTTVMRLEEWEVLIASRIERLEAAVGGELSPREHLIFKSAFFSALADLDRLQIKELTKKIGYLSDRT